MSIVRLKSRDPMQLRASNFYPKNSVVRSHEGNEVMRKTTVFIVIGLFAMCFIFTSSTYANIPTVTIKAPSSAVKGSEVTIKIHVEHNNSFTLSKWGIY